MNPAEDGVARLPPAPGAAAAVFWTGTRAPLTKLQNRDPRAVISLPVQPSGAEHAALLPWGRCSQVVCFLRSSKLCCVSILYLFGNRTVICFRLFKREEEKGSGL